MTAHRTPRPARARPHPALAALAASVLLVFGGARAQDQSAPAAGAAAQPAAGGGQRAVAVDAAGGPASLSGAVAAAIRAWKQAAPTLVGLTVDPAGRSSIAYAPPALLGPDTLSLDLGAPGADAISVEVAAGAVQQHPMVLLHEVGVLLGLPEGNGDVMAFAVPPTGEPDGPSKRDVANLQAERTYAPEDLNHDGTVDFYDLVLFGQAFGSQGVNLPADFNHDGRVDAQDLALLQAAYQFSPPSETAPGAAPAPSEGSGAASGGSPGDGASSGGAGGDAARPNAGSSNGAASTPQDGGAGGGP